MSSLFIAIADISQHAHAFAGALTTPPGFKRCALLTGSALLDPHDSPEGARIRMTEVGANV